MNQEAKTIRQLYTEESLSLREISRRLNRNHHYVARRLTEAGIKVARRNTPRKMVVGIQSTRLVYNKVCGVCQRVYQTTKTDQQFCSHTCRGIAVHMGLISRRDAVEIILATCPECGEDFTYPAYWPHKYCRRRCFELAHSKRMGGKGNPAYKNGSSYNKACFRGETWDIIRQCIYERDNYICQSCGVKCIAKSASTPETTHLIIQCHHIKPYEGPEDNADSNLLTLCLACHLTLHNYTNKRR